MTKPTQSETPGPLSALGILATSQVQITPSLDHVEMYSARGLLSLMWHGEAGATSVVLMVGGALGGLLGPGKGLYHRLGEHLAAQGIASIRVGYRSPNDLEACVHDTMASAELAARAGADRFVVIGHSFGGAVAVETGVALGGLTAGVVTVATQVNGCENGDALVCPVLHIHGDADTLLPSQASEMVQMLTQGELMIVPGGTHLLSESDEALFERLADWIPAAFEAHAQPAQ